MIVFNNKFKIS